MLSFITNQKLSFIVNFLNHNDNQSIEMTIDLKNSPYESELNFNKIKTEKIIDSNVK